MPAALYLRSSKDRSDVSIAAQARELEQLAQQRGLQITRRYEDAVEPGSTEDRPGFLALIRDLKNQHRGWDHLLVYDTSRIARRRYIAQALKHDARKRGVKILYAKLPADLDPIAEIVLQSSFEAMDEVHSLMSREKGLAGMAENVRQGWRAGGRAPLGYRLEHHATGAMREGKPVTKSRLVLGDQAEAVRAFLTARAGGTPRSRAREHLPIAVTTLVCMEWNALAYAGHTVWNVHATPGSGRKRRPRSEWVMQRDTHPALISEAQAETLIRQLECSSIGQAVSRGKQAMGQAILGGKLVTSDGQAWTAHGPHYRLRRAGGGRLVRAAVIERAVIEQLRADCDSEVYLAQLVAAVKQAHQARPGHDIEARMRKLERERTRAAELALEDGAFLQLVAERSRQLEALRRELDARRRDDQLGAVVQKLTASGLRELLADQDPATRIELLVERITLDPDLTCRMFYRAAPGAACGDPWRPHGDSQDSHPALVRVLKVA